LNVKLTLRLDQRLIVQAKKYAHRTGRSVSQIVAEYFSHLDSHPTTEDIELTPTVRSLKGILQGHKVDRSTYHRHLEDKYL